MRLSWVVVVMGLIWFSGGRLLRTAWAEEWKVRSEGRPERIFRHWVERLRRRPKDSLAWKKVRMWGSNESERREAVVWLRRWVLEARRPRELRVVLARLLMSRGRWYGALREFRRLRGRARWRWEEAHCLWKLKRYEEAGKIYSSLFVSSKRFKPRSPWTQRRRQGVRRWLLSGLWKGDAKRVHAALVLLRKERGSWSEWRAPARWLAEHGFREEAVSLYRAMVKRARGRAQATLWLRWSRLERKGRRYAEALRCLQKARRVQSLPQWLRWEMFEEEVRVYRAQGKIPIFFRHIQQRWKGTTQPQRLLWLGQLAEEAGLWKQARASYEVMVKARPNARVPRERLVAWFLQRKQPEKAQRHMEILIRQNQAKPSHYFHLVEFLLKRSLRPSLGRWKPSWVRLYEPGGPYVRQFATSSEHPAVQARVFCRSRREHWEECREQRWRFWKTYEAKAAHHRLVRQSTRLLKRALQRFSNHEESLRRVEELADRYGFSGLSRQAFQRWLTLREVSLASLRRLRLLLRSRGAGEKVWRTWFRRVLRPRSMPFANAVATAYEGWEGWRKDWKPRKQRYFQEKRVCRDIVRFLRPILLRTTFKWDVKSNLKSDRLRRWIRAEALFAKCGGRLGAKPRSLPQVEKAFLRRGGESSVEWLLNTYMQLRFVAGFQRILHLLGQKKKLSMLFHFLQTQIDAGKSLPTSFLLHPWKGLSPQAQVMRARLLVQLCRSKSACFQLKPWLVAALHSRHVPVREGIRLLAASAEHSLFGKERPVWAKQLYLRAKDKPRVLVSFAEELVVFWDDRLPKQSALALHSLFRRMVWEALAWLPPSFRLSKRWDRVFLALLRASNTLKKTRLRLLENHAEKAKGGPRGLLYAYFHTSGYHDRGMVYLSRILSPTQPLSSWKMLAWVPVGLLLPQRAAWQRRMCQVKNREVLAWLVGFLERRGWAGVRLAVLRCWLRLAPTQSKPLQELALGLSFLPGKWSESQRLWKRWAQLYPQEVAFSRLERMSRLCCRTQRARYAFAFRLGLSFSQSRAASSWSTYEKLLQQRWKSLGSARQVVLSWLASAPGVSASRLLAFAREAQREGWGREERALLLRVVSGQQGRLQALRGLAESLDAARKFSKASEYWTRWAKERGQTLSPRWFRLVSRRAEREGRRWLAVVAWFRSLNHQDAVSLRELERWFQRGDEIRAWAHWLRRLGPGAKRCLEPKATWARPFPAEKGASLAPPFFWGAFAPCDWALGKRAQRSFARWFAKHRAGSKSWWVATRGVVKREPTQKFLARARAFWIQRWLMQRGISAKQIQLQQGGGWAVCQASGTKNVPSSSAWVRGLQEAFCRQIQRSFWVSSPMQIDVKRRLWRDVDRDRVPDLWDRCPYQAGSVVSWWQGRGCPQNPSPLRLTQEGNRLSSWKGAVPFSRYGNSVLPKSGAFLAQLVAFLRTFPSHRWRLELHPTMFHPDLTFYHRFQAQTQSNAALQQQLEKQAKQDGENLVRWLQRLGLSDKKIQLQIRSKPYLVRSLGEHRHVTFWLTARREKKPKKAKESSR